MLRAADAPGPRRRPVRAGPLPVPDQGARPGPGQRALGARPGSRAGDLGGDLRRRHPGADPLGDPDGRPGRRHEPGHAPFGDPAPPHEVVPALRAAPDHRRRRAPHVPRRVREPRRERPAPAPPAVRPLRLAPGHRLLLGHDREPGRAGRAADRPAEPAHRPQRGALGRAPPPARRAALARSRDRGPWIGPDPRPAVGPAVPAGRPPDDRLRPVAGRGRGHPDRPPRGPPRELRPAEPGPRLPRRLPADGAPLDRARPARRRGARRRQHERARARGRRRPARRVDPGRLPRLDRRDLAADRAGGPAQRDERGRARRLGCPGRPLRRRPPGVPPRECAGGGADRPGQPPRPARPHPGGHVRAALRAGRGLRPGAGRRPARVPRRGGPRPAGRRRSLVLVVGELPGLGDLAPDRRSGERRHHRHDPEPAAGASARSTCSRPRSSSTRRRSTSTSRSSTTSTSSTGTSARRTSGGSTPTTTPTPTGR